MELFTSSPTHRSFEGDTILPETNVSSAVLADLDGDGLREVIGRQLIPQSTHLDPMRNIVVVSGSSSRPRAELVFDSSCYGGWVDVPGVMRRRILPYGNTGSYGHGTPSITFPLLLEEEDEVATVTDVYGSVQEIPLTANRREQVHCQP